jgi:hypothetical protein
VPLGNAAYVRLDCWLLSAWISDRAGRAPKRLLRMVVIVVWRPTI